MSIPALLAAGPAPRPPAKPNIVMILADDLGYADVGFNGSRDIATPHLDSLARAGVRCTNAYVSHPFCSPTRAGLLTGRYQQRFGHEDNPIYNPKDEISGLPLSETLLPAVLKKAGYATGLVGKWHLGAHPKYHPMVRGFDEFFGFLGGGHQYFPEKLTGTAEYTTPLSRNGSNVEETEYLTDALAREAAAFVDRHQDEPFFLLLTFNAPHNPRQVPAKYLERFAHIGNARRREYAGLISAVDDGVGRVLARLKANELDESTLVVFHSDNGGPLGDTGNGSTNTPLRGGKSSMFEGGLRVPYVARWTGTLPAAKEYDAPISSLDLFATAVAIAGATPPDKPLDGVNIIPYFRGDKPGRPHETLFWRTGGGTSKAVRHGDWKLVKPAPDRTLLFDLARDVGESIDVAAEQAERVKELTGLLDAWNAQLVPPAFPGLESTARDAARKKQAAKKR